MESPRLNRPSGLPFHWYSQMNRITAPLSSASQGVPWPNRPKAAPVLRTGVTRNIPEINGALTSPSHALLS